MTPAAFASALGRKQAALEREILAAEAENVRDALQTAVKLSSGTVTTAQLRLLGHPYATRDPRAVNPQIINSQTGLLRSSWQAQQPRLSLGGIISKVTNSDPKSIFMLGTRRMIKRPISEAVVAEVTPRRLRRLQRALSRALSA